MFSKATKNTKSSPSIQHLLSKRQIYGEDSKKFCELLGKHKLYCSIQLFENFKICIDLNFFGIVSLFPTYETIDLPN